MAKTRSYRLSLSKKERKIIRHLQKKATSSNTRIRYAILLAAYARWTVTLLAEESTVILEESMSCATVGRVMKRNETGPI